MSTLQQLIDAASNYDTVQPPNGVYRISSKLLLDNKPRHLDLRGCTLVSDKPSVLAIVNSGGSTIQGGQLYAIPHIPQASTMAPAVTILDSSDVVLDGVQIAFASQPVEMARSHRVKVKNCVIVGNVNPETTMQHLYHAIQTTSDYTSVTGCKFFWVGSAVLVGSPARYTTINKNLVDGYGDNGIYASTSLGLRCENNTIRNGYPRSSSAIKNHGSLALINANIIEGGTNGIAILGSRSHGYEHAMDNTINNNQIIGCRAYGITVSQHSVETAGYNAVVRQLKIIGNEITNCGDGNYSHIRVVSGANREIQDVIIADSYCHNLLAPASKRWYAIYATASMQGPEVNQHLKNIAIEDNDVRCNDTTHGWGLRLVGATGYRIAGNTYWGANKDESIEKSTE
jgi:hypothetical protein